MIRPADTIKVGDTIMPPERELRLWMRRHVEEHNLPECALHLTVTEVRDGTPDKRGRWLIVKSEQAPEWGARLPFSFRVRPATPWVMVA